MIGKLDTFWNALRDLYPGNPEMAAIMSAAVALIALVAALRDPDKSEEHKNRVRIARFCLNCSHFDSQGETCAMEASSADMCGLIDKRTGMVFSITKD